LKFYSFFYGIESIEAPKISLKVNDVTAKRQRDVIKRIGFQTNANALAAWVGLNVWVGFNTWVGLNIWVRFNAWVGFKG